MRTQAKKQRADNWSWYVYVIECADGLYYTGMTWELSTRIEQHRLGKGGAFTERHGFKVFRYAEEYEDLEETRLREIQIKNYSRKKKEALWEGSSLPSASKHIVREGHDETKN